MTQAKQGREVIERLARIEAKLDALLEDAGVQSEGPRCGSCGSEDVVEDVAFGEQRRVVCRDCLQVTVLEQGATNG